MRADVAIVAALVIVLCVVTTPPRAVGAFAGYAALVVLSAVVAGMRPVRLLRSLTIELPFIGFAVLLPVVGVSPRTEVFGLSLSIAGLWAAWNIVAKATLSVATMSLLRFLVPADELVDGLRKLRVPDALLLTMSLMIRYGEVLRQRTIAASMARRSRGDNPRWLWQGGAAIASSAQLFVRSYGRSERVSMAMAARGFDGIGGSFAVYSPIRQPHLEFVVPIVTCFLAVAVGARVL